MKISNADRAILIRRIRVEVDKMPWNISYACKLATDYLFIKKGVEVTERQASGLYYNSVRGLTTLKTQSNIETVHQTKNVRRAALTKAGDISKRSVMYKYKTRTTS